MLTNNRTRTELLQANDSQIDDALTYADPMVLRGLLYLLTGDPELTGVELQSVQAGSTMRPALGESDVARLRKKAGDFLKSYRDRGAGPVEVATERVQASMSLTVGVPVEGDYRSRSEEELGLDPWARGLVWQQTPPAERLKQFNVTIIGAALGGLNAALQLKRAGIPYRVIEKNSGVGGTWFENRYPGARVDTASRGYTHIFGVDFPYPNPYCPWDENERYFNWIADEFDLRKDITFNTEVRSLTWDEATANWVIEIDGPEGEQTLRSNAVITAVGFLNRPNVPQFEGADQFEGPSWHTARWPEGFDPKGKRIAVVGTGCSGYQTTPELALEAEHLTLFQRTPQWLVEVPGYRSPFPPQVNWLDRNLPFHTNFMRLRTLAGANTVFGPATDIDPAWEDPYTVNPSNKAMRDASMAFLKRKLKDPALVEKMTPPHPPWSARPVMVDPEYSVLDAIQRDNVTLVTEGVRRINRTGIEDGDGKQHDVDAIVYATGFKATQYLFPMTIRGRGGRTIDELWDEGGARSYNFAMYPGFPNLWSLYAPNTNGGLLPSAFHEMVTRYAMECMEQLILDDKKSVDAREDAYWRFNEMIDERNNHKVWSDPRAHNYYWTEHGRSAVMCPLTPDEVWRLVRHPNWEELEVR